MTRKEFDQKLARMLQEQEAFLGRKNDLLEFSNGVYNRYRYPVLTAQHTPLTWKYDFDFERNPHLLERIGINAAFNAGAMEIDGKIALIVRVEGVDRKSFFAVAESYTGVDNFRFRDYPITMPETDDPDTNVYDMRVVKHEDGWIYGLFCTERRNSSAPDGDQTAAVAQCGIARTKDLNTWERLPDLITYSGQQRNVVLHPEFVNGKYALYTRPQDGFIDTGSGGGIGWGLSDSMENAEVKDEVIVDPKVYHTIKEVKNGLGPAPIKTDKGWLHLAHGVRNTAAGLRYVLYMFMTALDKPWEIIYRPAGYFIAPEGDERVGDVSNVVFSNGWVARENGDVFIYYASSDTRMHVATSTVEKLIDYVINTPKDGLRSYSSVQTLNQMIKRNLALLSR